MLAVVAQQQGRLEESEGLYRRAIACAEEWAGPGPDDISIPTLAVDRRNLAAAAGPPGPA